MSAKLTEARKAGPWMPLREMDEEWIARNFGLLSGLFSEGELAALREEGGEDASWLQGEGWRVWDMGERVYDSHVTTGAHACDGDAWDEAQRALD